ncbi:MULTISPECIES: hypothetical protein [unclassified Leeuwenhoekiella]|uniref:hypothetical protein n=1 Tax=unclassified Leeuwenhoekiella TaxID=2615029 RepID=UPI000C38E9F5|nr:MULTISPECIES: hypothetical protein [unclassified Leeuwenhoekiella]MAW95160.1 hypothetical protein [Leeuwenhoekiella sp.]MBA81917.1 hypothetical protein [Leeuwenhoekiella sp.]|tara:strand:- start:4944 stop:5801 length:858 start_codon:yes stop_codon:yes gene_type:complete
MNNYINFKRQRELGETLTDTFKFLRQEYKGLFQALLRNAAIPFIILIAAAGYYATISADSSLFDGGIFSMANLVLPAIILLLAVLFYYAVMYGTVLHYIRLYIENRGVVDQDILKNEVRSQLGSLIGVTFLIALIVFFGLMLCILPGIYLAIPLSLGWALLVFKNKPIGDVISDSFKLVKGEWWMTFATMFVLGLLLYVANIVFSLPVIIYTLVKAFTSGAEISQGNMSGLFDWVYLTLNVIASAAQYILAVIFPIAIAFIYYNLNEKTNQTGAFETIDSIGTDR